MGARIRRELPAVLSIAVLTIPFWGGFGALPGGAWQGLGVPSARAQGAGGGTVADVAPDFEAFTASLATVDNSGSSFVVFSATIFDANGESHFAGAVVTVVATGAVLETFSHTITLTEAQTADEPASYGTDGFKVFSDVRYDGVLYFKLKYTIPAGTGPGTATFTPTVTLPGGSAAVGPAASVQIVVHSEITIDPEPVDGNGVSTEANWGLWDAVPGATFVSSANFIKVLNSGQRAAASFVVSFSQPAFTGANPNYEIPINGNTQFAWCEVESEQVSPSSCSFVFGGTTSDGSATATFSAVGRVIYVQYRVVEIPSVAASQTYGAAYTVTEV